MIDITVAMPVYNARDIIWLALESLCNQVTEYKWELIVAEEKHDKMIEDDILSRYEKRLRDAGCQSIKYLEYENWIPLSIKWKHIGEHSDINSKVFMLHASDCYSSKDRIQEAGDSIIMEGFDWIDYSKGFFYNLMTDQMIQYSASARTNLDMSFKTEYARTIPYVMVKKGVDNFLITHCIRKNLNFKKKQINDLKMDSIDTDGMNNISIKRLDFYNNTRYPFVETDVTLDDLDLPEMVKSNLKRTAPHNTINDGIL